MYSVYYIIYNVFTVSYKYLCIHEYSIQCMYTICLYTICLVYACNI